MKNIYKHLVTTFLLATSGLPGTLMAESDTGDGSTPVAANLNFEIEIPGILNFQVGTAGGAIDKITFAPLAANLGDNSNVAGTGGNLTGGVVTVELLSNAGQVVITPTYLNPGAGLTSTSATDTIPYDEILTSSNLPELAAPVLSNVGGGATMPTETDGVTDLKAQWTYTYDNTAVYEAGTYGGVDIQGSRVTYTASIP